MDHVGHNAYYWLGSPLLFYVTANLEINVVAYGIFCNFRES